MIPGLIVAAGGIVRRGGRVLVVRRPRYGDCSLPKGKLKEGEAPLEAALREVREETGYELEALCFAGSTSYLVRGTPKVVLFWHMEAGSSGAVKDPGEVAAVEWMTRGQALDALTYPLERKLLEEAWGSGEPGK